MRFCHVALCQKRAAFTSLLLRRSAAPSCFFKAFTFSFASCFRFCSCDNWSAKRTCDEDSFRGLIPPCGRGPPQNWVGGQTKLHVLPLLQGILAIGLNSFPGQRFFALSGDSSHSRKKLSGSPSLSFGTCPCSVERLTTPQSLGLGI